MLCSFSLPNADSCGPFTWMRETFPSSLWLRFQTQLPRSSVPIMALHHHSHKVVFTINRQIPQVYLKSHSHQFHWILCSVLHQPSGEGLQYFSLGSLMSLESQNRKSHQHNRPWHKSRFQSNGYNKMWESHTLWGSLWELKNLTTLRFCTPF